MNPHRRKNQAARRQHNFAAAVLRERRERKADLWAAVNPTENPNRGKRHAARMAPMAENSGARRKNEPRITLTQTRNGRTLPPSKNLQAFETVKLPTD